MIQMMRKRYSEEFKVRAVEVVVGGKPVPEAARELGIGSGILYRWVSKVARAMETESKREPTGDGASPADELRVLRRENARLQLENDILKKAAVILGSNRPPNAGR